MGRGYTRDGSPEITVREEVEGKGRGEGIERVKKVHGRIARSCQSY